MPTLTSDWLIERVTLWGVRRIYGYPGDGINGVLGALQRADKAGRGLLNNEDRARARGIEALSQSHPQQSEFLEV
jgi:hypothetical protein